MSRYMPVYMHPDMMPIDISFVFKDEIPAGKHGFCRVNGENFEFEDGTPAKFWGVMFNGAACFPTHEKAEEVAQRLRQTGVNLARFHQLDDEWMAPNLYRMTTGERVRNTRDLCEKSLERLDYFVKCLKENGIYISVDMTTYRRFKPGDGVKDAELLDDAAHFYSMYDPRMIELQKEFCEKFWQHQNPYTGLKNADDPVFVICIMINENDTFINHTPRRCFHLIPSYIQEFRDMFASWLKEKGIEYDAYGCDLFTKDQVMQEFKMELLHDYADDMYAHLRSVGCKIPITCSNYTTCYGIRKAWENMDFCDAHSYFYDWLWGEEEKICAHASISKWPTSPLANHCTNRIHGKPMFMSEWDVPYPNAFRAEGALWHASMCCLQNWVGMTAHTYGYGHDMSKFDLLGKVASTSTIGGVPYREGIFAVWNDPAHWGLYYHCCLMVRRGDVQKAKEVYGMDITPEFYGKQSNVFSGTASEIHQVHTVLDTCRRDDLTALVSPREKYEREDPNVIVSDTGELKRYVTKGYSTIDTPRTKSVYGKCGQPAVNKVGDHFKTHELNDVTFKVYTDFATVTMSSLTNDPISKSNNILLTAVGRARNHGAQFDGDKMLDPGTNPIEIEVIRADVELKTDRKKLEVWSIDSEGFYSGKLDTTYDEEKGILKFAIGDEFACQYYLIVEP